MAELRPGMFRDLFARQVIHAQAATTAGLIALALDIERETKTALGRTSHRYGTRTPARPGGPPALISGTLRRSITHTRPTPVPGGVEVRVGVGSGFHPTYPGRRASTSSSRYGLYLETGLRNGTTYPFLLPAADKVFRTSQVAARFRAAWRT